MVKQALMAAGFMGALMATPAIAERVVNDIADGQACQMSFRVAELRTPYVVGHPLGSSDDDAHLQLIWVEDRKNPLCVRAVNSPSIVVEGDVLASAGITFEQGDRFTATVFYQRQHQGLLPLDAWNHLVVIEAGANAPAVLPDLDIR